MWKPKLRRQAYKKEADSKFYYQFKIYDGWTDMEYAKFEGDIYMLMMEVFGDEDFAMDMLVWCENAKEGFL